MTQPPPIHSLTIKQIYQSNMITDPSGQELIIIDNIPVRNCCIIGYIKNIEMKSNKIELTITDNTSTIKVEYWKNDNKCTLTNLQFMIMYPINSYIKIFGKIKYFNRAFSVTAFNINLIQDFNQVTYHFTECIYQHVYKQKNKKNTNSSANKLQQN